MLRSTTDNFHPPAKKMCHLLKSTELHLYASLHKMLKNLHIMGTVHRPSYLHESSSTHEQIFMSYGTEHHLKANLILFWPTLVYKPISEVQMKIIIPQDHDNMMTRRTRRRKERRRRRLKWRTPTTSVCVF